ARRDGARAHALLQSARARDAFVDLAVAVVVFAVADLDAGLYASAAATPGAVGRAGLPPGLADADVAAALAGRADRAGLASGISGTARLAAAGLGDGVEASARANRPQRHQPL